MQHQTTTFYIEGLCCAEEERLIQKKLHGLPGIEGTDCAIVSRKLTVRHTCPVDTISAALRQIGMPPRLHFDLDEPQTFWEKYQQHLTTGISGALLLLGVNLKYFWVSPDAVTIPIFLASVLTGIFRVAGKGLRAARHASLDMNFLMFIATVGAVAIGKLEEASAVIFLFSLSQLLERYTMDRSRRAIRSLRSLTPSKATVRRGLFEYACEVEDVSIGERLVIRPGEQIPLDGVVVGGQSSVNQMPITGESQPVNKLSGDEVHAGSLNERGTLEVRVSRRYYDTTLARIIQKVEEAQAARAPIQNFADRFAAWYTPAVVLAAILISIGPPLLLHQPFGTWFYRALVLLVIACPCALVISTPVTIISGLSNTARRGVLVKGGRHLESIGSVNAIAIDKTGTLTVGRPRVTDVIPLNGLGSTQLLRIAASVESKSEHHLAGAILARAAEESISFHDLTHEHFESLTGRGVRAKIGGEEYFVGSHALLEEKQLCSPGIEEILEKLEGEGKTTMVVGSEREPIGVIAIADTLRPGCREMIGQLRREGVKRVIMLTGDNEGTARAIADRAGIREYYAGILPDEKVSRLQELKERYGKVAMIGDGINDAPALAASTVGIAMGTSGTDVALETADVVLMSDNLSAIPSLMGISRKTLSIVKQNMAIALVTKLIFLVLGMFGIASLWMAVLADDGATLVVILNGLRALQWRDTPG